MFIKSYQLAKRIIIVVIGFTVLLLGLVMAIPLVPGPGILVIPAGLAILALEFVWARKLLKRFKAEGARFRDLFFGKKKDGESKPKASKKES